ncbi:MAG TPA: RNA-guided endonuclease IscB [Ktedonobacteraceae bacterium]|nr:RNA-guided endonuclease IscB [Ktedonobacteraceae bacterium]
MSYVFVLDTNKQPVNPVDPGRARILLTRGEAAVYRLFPFTIILKTAVEATIEPLRVKIDPGSKTTGIAIVNDATGEVVYAAELSHQGEAIKKRLDKRRGVRRSRRHRRTRYRQARWRNRRNKKKGWLAPSLQSRITNILTWVNRFRQRCYLTAISMELVKFDTQLMENAEISGVEYQQGTLAGYEVREYLLQKWGRKCAYCGKGKVQLQIEQMVPRAKLGTNRISNLCLACDKCNKTKGTKDIAVFLKKKPDLLKNVLAQANAPLRDAAAVNTTRWELFRRLEVLGLPIECGSGGLTKYNRSTRKLPKTHWLDAACVGKSTPLTVQVTGVQPLLITANGHGRRRMCCVDENGFTHGNPKQAGRKKGFKTGDIVKAIVTEGKHIGIYVGRVAARATGSFNITTKRRTIQGIGHQYCRALHRSDGYSYQRGATLVHPQPEVETVPASSQQIVRAEVDPCATAPKKGRPVSSPQLRGYP